MSIVENPMEENMEKEMEAGAIQWLYRPNWLMPKQYIQYAGD